jgi:hypothetical protein
VHRISVSLAILAGYNIHPPEHTGLSIPVRTGEFNAVLAPQLVTGSTIPVSAIADPSVETVPNAPVMNIGGPNPPLIDMGEPNPPVIDSGGSNSSLIHIGEPNPPVMDIGGPNSSLIYTGEPNPPVMDIRGPNPSLMDMGGPNPPVMDIRGPNPPVMDIRGPNPPITSNSRPEVPVMDAGHSGPGYPGPGHPDMDNSGHPGPGYPGISDDPPVKNIEKSNTTLSSLGIKISFDHAFIESAKLFDKKRPQIVALWCLETATNGSERILQRTYKFDSLRRKYVSHYFKLALLMKNFNSVLTVLNWTLYVSNRTMTATLYWITKEAVNTCLQILQLKYECLKGKSEAKHSDTVEMTGMSLNTSTDVNIDINMSVSTGNTDELNNEDKIDQNINHNKIDIDNNPNDNNNIINDDSINNTDQSKALQLLKQAYELYNLISKEIDTSILQKIKIIIIKIFSLTGRCVADNINENTKMIRNSSLLENTTTTIDKNTDFDDGKNNGINSEKGVNDDDNKCRESNINGEINPEFFKSIMGDCLLMWSTKSLAGNKRKLYLKQQESKQQEVSKQQLQQSQPPQQSQQQQLQQQQQQQQQHVQEIGIQEIVKDVSDEHSDKIAKISDTVHL